MLSASISDFRKDIKKYLDDVSNNYETLIINRGKEGGVVVISLEEYNSLNSTYHEKSSKVNVERLQSAMKKVKEGNTFKKQINLE